MDNSLYILLTGVTFAICANLAVYAWSRWKTPLSMAFIALMAGISEWALAYVLQLSSTSPLYREIFHRLSFIGIVTVPVAWLVFTIVYTGRIKWLTRRNLVYLYLVPAITLLVIATNELHFLMWPAPDITGINAIPISGAGMGPWFWVHTMYSYSALFFGVFWLSRTFLDATSLYRRQSGIMLIGAAVPWLANVLFIFEILPLGNVDPTPVALGATGMFAFWCVMRFQLLEVMPVARDTLIRDIRDGIIVIDTQKQVLDLNPAAQGMLGYSSFHAMGKPLSGVFPESTNEIEAVLAPGGKDAEFTLGDGETKSFYRVHASPLYDRGNISGYLLLLYDITEQRVTELRLGEILKEEIKLREQLALNTRDKFAFIGVISQQLRTELAELTTDCEHVATSGSPEVQLRLLHNTTQRIKELDGRVEDFIDFLKSETGDLEITLGPVELAGVVKQVEKKSFLLSGGENMLPMHLDLPPILPPVLADKNRLQQALSVLVQNMQLLSRGNSRIAFRVRETGKNVEIEVTDNGLGISPEEIGQLFEPYAAAKAEDPEMTQQRVCFSLFKRLVELQGGTMALESNPDRGSKFSIYLPIAPAGARS